MKTPSKYQPHQGKQEAARRHRQYPHGTTCPPSKSMRRVRTGWRFAKSMGGTK